MGCVCVMTQLMQLGALCAFLFVLTACAADAVPAVSSVRAPPPDLEGLLALPAASQAYQYVLFKLGPATITRRSVALACNTATLSFSMLQVRSSVCRGVCISIPPLGIPTRHAVRKVDVAADSLRMCGVCVWCVCVCHRVECASGIVHDAAGGHGGLPQMVPVATEARGPASGRGGAHHAAVAAIHGAGV